MFNQNAKRPAAASSVLTGSYTLAGSSISAYAYTQSGVSWTIVNNGDGTATASFANIAQTYRTGMQIRIGGYPTPVFNQFCSTIVDHDRTATMGWIKFTITGPYSLRQATQEATILIDGLNTQPDNSRNPNTWARLLYPSNMRCIGNYAIAGGDTQDNLNVFDATHAIARPNFVIFDVNTNDIYSRGWSASETIAKNQQLIDRIIGIGAKPWAMTMSPRTAGVTTAFLDAHLAVNDWYLTEATRQGVIVTNVADTKANGLTFADPASANYNPSTGMLADGVHYDRAGGYAVGFERARVAPSVAVSQPVKTISSVAEAARPNVRYDNAALSTTPGVAPGTGVTGTLPNNSTCTRAGAATIGFSTIARTVAADGDAYGVWGRYAVTSTAANDGVTITFTNTNAASFANDIAVRGALLLRVSANTIVRSLKARLVARYTRPEDSIFWTLSSWAMQGDGATGATLNEALNFALPMERLKLALAANNSGPLDRVYLEVFMIAAGAGTVNIDIAHPSIWSRD
ncbi:SGNH/GDSL hydrolase family protein [Chitinolyticbacter meiyuanensis]|uniref:SGNH/GDSL hydrolase family protein n=1 Tax=Chitinolyticbacter meiyuanensis TaxID=682798 RepID=UPI0011E59B94|nr:SGNH/GDSL hydrolase family protein [Chitinolyticbacter meiyuanensis]